MHAFLHSRGTRTALLLTGLTIVYALLVTYVLKGLDVMDEPVKEAVLVVGVGLLLGLRLNRAYERWWEARTLWGNLVNASRNLAVKCRAFAHPDDDEARFMARSIAGFADALRGHLRGGVALREIPGFEDADEDPRHVPLWLSGRIYAQIQAWDTSGRITSEQMRTLDLEARALLEVAGSCERIQNTPMPPSITILARGAVGLALLGLPWVLYEEGSPLWIATLVGLMSFTLLVLETTSGVVEHPFGTDANELDLDGLCVTIRTSVGEALASAEAPGA
jgi:putative membrane protein